MRKAEVLLAYLALVPGLRHPRERLINLLWSDRSEEQARNSLRQCLSAIKKSLGASADMILQVDRTTICLKAEMIDIDVHEFERLAEQGNYESLTTAASLYLGEFLEGISIRDAACQDWLDGERARFKRQFIEILTNLGETLLVTRDFGAAIKSLERLVEQDPLGESGWRLLMRSYFENGDRSHALQAFKRCQQALRNELEVEPEQATIKLRDQFAGAETRPAPAPTPVTTKPLVDFPPTTDHSIAVLPFDNLSGDPEQEYFSDGITDSIILNLSLFPGLQVKSRNSSFAFKKQIKSPGEISQELNVDYMVEGSIRKSQDRIRITVQLIEASSGNQVWGKRYDANLENLFDLEEDLSRSIAATVTGQIESDLQRIALAKGAAHQLAYDLLLQGTYFLHRSTAEDTVRAIASLNQCLDSDADNVFAHGTLYNCHMLNWMERWLEDYEPSFELAGKHAAKALALDPESGLANYAIGEFMMFSRNYLEADKYFDKALAINPNDPDSLTAKAVNLQMQGHLDVAYDLAQKAYQLDPFNWWVDWNLAEAQYLTRHYRDAIETIEKSTNAPGFIKVYAIAAHVKLGNLDVARSVLQEFLSERRNSMAAFPMTQEDWLRYTTDTAPFVDQGINRGIIDCLLQAGLEEELELPQSLEGSDQQPGILVLPFSNLSGDPEQEYFSSGISDSIIVSLSSFSGLQVKSRHTSVAFRDSAKSIEEIGDELGIQYIVEGSIRKLGENVRITVQLGDTANGNQVWGKRYDSPLENLFELEEELVQTIAGTVSGRIDHETKVSSLRKPAKDLRSYDYLMQGAFLLEKFNAADSIKGREQLGKCLEIDPDNADALAMLAVALSIELFENWTLDREKTRAEAYQHIQRAIQLAPENAYAHAYLAEHQLFTRDFKLGLFHANKSIELNPTQPDGYSVKCYLLAICRRLDEALENADISMQIDPHHYYMGWNAGEVYRMAGQYQKAIDTFRSIPHPSPSVHAEIAACLVGLGHEDEARIEMQQYLELAREQMAAFPRTETAWRKYWYEVVPCQHDEDFEIFYAQLNQAGLCEDLIEAADDTPSIAVLPFENMSGDPEQEHFADGITTDIIATLSKFRHMRTISRYSTMQYKLGKPAFAEIAAQQGVRYLLEGSVRKSGDRIRVNAELIDSNGGQILWNERYDRDLDDLFAVQDEITKNIALAMKVQFDDGEMALHRSKGTSNIKAWELTLAATDLLDTYIRQNILEARAMAEEAIKLDPDYAYAWIALGWTYWQEANSGWGESIDDLMLQAENACNRAFELDSDYSEAWSLAGLIHLMKHEPDAAIEACRKAVEREPGNAEAQALTAYTYVFNSDYDQGQRHNQNMLKLCPIRANWYYLIGAQIEKITGNLEKAAELCQQGINVEPDSPLCRFYLIDVLMEQNDVAGAGRLADEIRALDSAVTGKGLVHGYMYDKALRDRFQAHLEKFDLY